jgi:hypothetical protein
LYPLCLSEKVVVIVVVIVVEVVAAAAAVVVHSCLYLRYGICEELLDIDILYDRVFYFNVDLSLYVVYVSF